MTSTPNKLILGSAPDSWGVWFPEDEHQLPWQRFLDELVEAGYDWLELGPYGYLPTDPEQLADEVGSRGLRVSGGTVFGALHRPDQWDEMLATTRKVAELTAAAGVCVEPPAGVPEIGPVTEALAGLDAPLFVIVEQDLYPCAPDVPLPIAVRTRKFLGGCGLGAAGTRIG
jgi:sugar phosphate isomerase/epimerase